MNNLFFIVVLVFLLSYLFTLFYKHLAVSHKVLDIPNERSSHFIPTPKGGGVAIVVTWYLGISLLFYLDLIPRNLFMSLICGCILAVTSFINDLIDLKPVIRLTAQGLTAILALWFIGGFNPVTLNKITISSPYILLPVGVIGMVWFINLFNFLDGIDGYASLEASTIGLIIFIITKNPICLVLLASILGFIIWNWPKAKIFMGDVGSTQLGFVLVVIGIYSHNTTGLSIIHWLMLSSVFWFDATLTLYRRWRNKENLSIAHKKHAYQRAVQSGLSHQTTIICSAIINVLIIGLVYLSFSFESLLLPLFFVNILFLYGLTKLIDRRVPFK